MDISPSAFSSGTHQTPNASINSAFANTLNDDHVTNTLLRNINDLYNSTEPSKQSLANQLLQAQSPLLTRISNDAVATACTKAKLRALHNPSVVVHSVLTSEEESTLNSMFPHFRIIYTKTSLHPHGFFDAQSRLVRKLLYSYMRVDTQRIPKGYHMLVKEVGGNPLHCVRDNHFTTHVCHPSLSYQDTNRIATSSHSLRMIAEDPAESEYARTLATKLLTCPIYSCRNRSEFCSIKAPYLLWLWSSFDLTPSEYADQMASANASFGYGAVHMNSKILFNIKGGNEGNLYWQTFSKNHTSYIKFWFKNDAQSCYVHRMDTYLSLIRSPQITTSDKKRSYNVVIMGYIGTVMLFKIIKPITECKNSFVSIPVPFSNEDMVVIRHYNLDETYTSTCVYLTVPKKFYKAVYSYTFTCKEGSFTPTAVIQYATSICNRRQVNGVILYDSFDIEPDDIITISYAIYFIVYTQRYKHQLQLALNIDDENKQRSARCSLSDFLSNIFSSATNQMLDCQFSYSPFDSDPMCAPPKDTYYTRLVAWFKKLTTRRRQFNTNVFRIPTVLSVEEYITVVLPELTTPEVVPEFVNLDFPSTPFDPPRFTPDSLGPEVYKPVELRPYGPKSCVIDTFAYFLHITPVTLIGKLSDLPAKLGLPADHPNMADMLFGDDYFAFDYIPYLAKFLHLSVTLRTDSISLIYDVGGTMHYCYCSSVGDVSHLCPLILDLHIALPSYIESRDADDVTSLGDAKSRADEVYQQYKTIDTKERKRREYNRQAFRPNNRPYTCMSAYKLLELHHKFDIISGSVFLDLCCAPGGFSQVLSNVPGSTLYGISKVSGIQIHDHTLYEDFNFNTDGDLLCPDNLVHFTDSLTALPSVDFICGDGVVSDNKGEIVPKLSDDLFGKEVELVLSVLTPGGNAMLKCLPTNTAQHILSLHSVFEEVKYVKPATSPSASLEFYVLCFNRSAEFKNVPEERTASILEKLTAFHTRLYSQQCREMKAIINNLPCRVAKLNDQIESLMNLHYVDPMSVPETGPVVECRNSAPTIFVPDPEPIAGPSTAIVPPTAPAMEEEAVIPTVDPVYDDLISFLNKFVVCGNAPFLRTSPITVSAKRGVLITLSSVQQTPPLTYGVSGDLFTVAIFSNEISLLEKYLALLSRCVSNYKYIPLWISFSSDFPMDVVQPLMSLVKPHLKEQCFTVESNLPEFALTDAPNDRTAIVGALTEYIAYLEAEIRINRENLKSHYVSYVVASQVFSLDRNAMQRGTQHSQGYGIVQIARSRTTNGTNTRLDWICPPLHPAKQYKTVFADPGDGEPVMIAPERLPEGTIALVSNFTAMPFATRYLEKANQALNIIDMLKTVSITFHQGIAGFGKTTRIVDEHLKNKSGNVLVLCPTNSGINVLIERTSKQYRINPIKDNYLTVTAVQLKNHVPPYTEVYIDEACMLHSGNALSLICQIKPKIVHLYGDLAQAPFHSDIPNMILNYSQLTVFSGIEVYTETHRLPADTTWAVRPLYAALHERLGVEAPLVTTHHHVLRSLGIHLITSTAQVPFRENTMYIGFTYNDVAELTRHFASETPAPVIETVKKFQGRENSHIIIFRSSRTAADRIYEDRQLILSAITRHTVSCTYYTMCNTDPLSEMINSAINASDEEINAVRIIKPVGSYEVVSLPYEVPLNGHYVPNLITEVSRFNDVHMDPSKFPSLVSMFRYLAARRVHEFSISKASLNRMNIRYNDLVRHASKYLPGCRTIQIVLSKGSEQITAQSNWAADNLMSRNCLINIPNRLTKSPTLPVVAPLSTDKLYVSGLIPLLQDFMNYSLPGQTYVDTSFDVYTQEVSEQEFFLNDCSFTTVPRIYKSPPFDCLRPLLSTPCPRMRPSTTTETLLAVSKRNLNPPELIDVINHENNACHLYQSFTSTYLIRGWSSILDQLGPIHINRRGIMDWLSKQDSSVASKCDPALPIWLDAIDRYKLSIKRCPKIAIAPDMTEKVQHLQTIVYSEKYINALFCVIQQHMSDRLAFLLDSRFMIYSKCSPSEFARLLDSVCPTDALHPGDQIIEADMSKFDKSQLLFVLLFECKMMTRFGVDPFYVDLWWNSHYMKVVTDIPNGLRFSLTPQRNSGDAFTFLFNTMFLMGVMAYTYDLSRVKFGLFSGDDSLIRAVNINAKPLTTFPSKFNLETKLFRFQSSLYFCSKFLIDHDSWHFVPDPVKLLIKLGTHSLANHNHCEEFRVSMCDLVSEYNQPDLWPSFDRILFDRYKISNGSLLVRALHHIATDPESFHSLFYSLSTDVLNNDPKWGNLDY